MLLLQNHQDTRFEIKHILIISDKTTDTQEYIEAENKYFFLIVRGNYLYGDSDENVLKKKKILRITSKLLACNFDFLTQCKL